MRAVAIVLALVACKPADRVAEMRAIATTVCACTSQQCVDESGFSAALARVKEDADKIAEAQRAPLFTEIERALACSTKVNDAAAWKKRGQDRPAGSKDSRWFKLHVPACDELVDLLDKTEGCTAVDRHAVNAAIDTYMMAARELSGGNDRAKMASLCRAAVTAATAPFAVCDTR